MRDPFAPMDAAGNTAVLTDDVAAAIHYLNGDDDIKGAILVLTFADFFYSTEIKRLYTSADVSC